MIWQRWRSRLRRRLGRRTLSLRLWLVLVVLAITGAGFLAQMGMVAPVAAWEQQSEAARLANVRQILGTDAARWRDPAWQRHADAALAALGEDVALFPGQPETPASLDAAVYMTAGARQFLITGGDTSTQTPQPTFLRVVIANPAPPANQPPIGVALLWEAPPSDALSSLLWAVVEWGSFALALAIVVWLIGQPVLRPLAEMSQAAESVAGGDLDIHLAPSPVREIATVSTALEEMSAHLRTALVRQDAQDEERRLFVGAVAHDLRTPLFMLRGYLKGLERGVATSPDKAARYLDLAQTQADALEHLVSDLFVYTRLEHLEQEPERLPLELGALLCETVEAVEPLAAAKHIALQLDGPGAPCDLLGDRHLLARAVSNLLDNALRHTPEQGEIRVCWQREPEAVAFIIEDSGPGLAPDDLTHLFTPLYRGEASRNRQTGGAGLGLAIAQRIIKAHSGSLSAANRPTRGARFTATLPATPHPASLAERATAATPAL